MTIKTWEERSVTLPDMDLADKQYANKHAMLDEIKELRARVAELEAELAAIRAQESIEIEWPDYHPQGMGCGLEDRGITDRYEAMQYGWDQALDHVGERLPEKLYLAAGAQPVPCPRCAELKQANSELAKAAIVKDGWQIVPDAVKQDAERYQWLTADLSTSDGRVERNELLSRMSVMSYSAASRDIDAAMLAEAKEPK